MGFKVYRDAGASQLVGDYATIAAAMPALGRSGLLVLPSTFVPTAPLALNVDNATVQSNAPGLELNLGAAVGRLTLTGPGAVEVTTAGALATVIGGPGGLVLHGGAGRDNATGGLGRDVLDGGAGDDVLAGGGGHDVLIGGTGRDRLDGGLGNDLLTATGDRVTMTGGAGADTFVVEAGRATTAIITDFNAAEGDVIVVRGAPAGFEAGAQQKSGQVVIAAGDAVVQVQGATVAGVRGHVSAEMPDRVVTFATVAEFVASGVAATETSVTIKGVTWELRSGEPPHAGFKVEAGGHWWSPDYLVVAAAGQSNMTGAGVGGDMTLSGNVAAWDWVNDRLVQASYSGAPANGPGIRTGTTEFNNLYFPFAEEMSAATGRPVLVIAHPVSGSQIETWVGDADVNWEALQGDIAQGLAAVGQDSVDAFLWLQGESDYPDASAWYEAQVLKLIDQVRQAGWGGADVAMLIGELSREGVNQTQNAALQRIELAERDPYLAFVSSTGLHTTSADGVHYDGRSLVELGHRFFDAYDEVQSGAPARANTAPTLRPGAAIPASITVVEGQELRLDMTGWFADAEGDALSYYGTLSKRGVFLIDPVSGGVVIDPDFAAAGTYTLRLYANDYRLDGPTVLIKLTVVDAAPGIAVFGNAKSPVVLLQTATFGEAVAGLHQGRLVDVLRADALRADVNLVAADNLTIRGAAGLTGDFQLTGTAARLTLDGAAAFDATGNGLANLLNGNAGANTLAGGAGSDRLYGNGGADVLLGGMGADSLYGGDGADRLAGGAEADRAWGGAGADTFVFERAGGEMRVMDFADGADRIEVAGFAGVTSYAGLLALATETQSRTGVTFAVGADRLVIDGVSLAQLSDADFTFAVA